MNKGSILFVLALFVPWASAASEDPPTLTVGDPAPKITEVYALRGEYEAALAVQQMAVTDE